MPSSDPHPMAERELAWLLHSGVAWALTGALILVAGKPLGDAVGVVLLVLGLGLIGWVLQRRHQPPRQLANWIFQHRSAKPQGPPRRQGGRHERVRVRPASGDPSGEGSGDPYGDSSGEAPGGREIAGRRPEGPLGIAGDNRETATVEGRNRPARPRSGTNGLAPSPLPDVNTRRCEA
jgi:hypothetical protein